jgi:hypothetical protein
MSFFGYEEPLGMPKGSVRAMLAVMLVGATIASAFIKPEIAPGLLTLATVVVKDYFEVRRNGQ